MRWCAPGYESALDTLVQCLDAATWPDPPEDFAHVRAPRPMRAVLAGTLEGPRGSVRVVVKWSRPDTLADRVSRTVRGGKGVREGRVLEHLRTQSVRVPEVLAYTDEGQDLVVTRYEEGLDPAPGGDAATPAQVEDVATLVALAHGAGLRHGDLHTGNLAFQGTAPVLVDVGGARLGGPLSDAERLRALGDMASSLLGEARRSQRFRALVHYMRFVHGAGGREVARATARDIDERMLAARRRYRRGRDRRATRTGKHFEVFVTPGGARGVRHRDVTDTDWVERADRWLARPPEDAVPLKAGGAVVRTGDVVLKRYEAVATGRLSRPVRAFRMAYGLINRGIAAPVPHLAAAVEDGSGVYAAGWVEAPNLHDFVADGRFEALERAERWRLLARLGRMLRLLHDAEVTHRDLKAPNLLVLPDLTCMIADLDGARIRRGPVRWVRRARDMMRLDASLDLTESRRSRILSSYHAVLPRPPEPLEAFASSVAVLSARKRGPSGSPR